MITGLFFGSFNPIHIGHLAIANYMLEFTDLEEIWFVVSPHNPLKEKETLLNDKLRLKMTRAAVAGDDRYFVSEVEFKLPRPSYTIDTLHHLQKLHPKNEFVLIMGSDGLDTFHLWKDYQKLVGEVKRYVYPRMGSNPDLLSPIENGKLIPAPILDISSTFIRESIAFGKNMRHFVPLPVWNIIDKKKLYR